MKSVYAQYVKVSVSSATIAHGCIDAYYYY